MPPSTLLSPDELSSRPGFTLVGALATLALLAAALAVGVPLVVKRLSARSPAAEAAAGRIESAVNRGLESVAALADSYGGTTAVWPARAAAAARAAALPDGPIRPPLVSSDAWDGPVNAPLFPPPWRLRPMFWQPLFARPAPWYFYRHPLWRAGGWRRK